VGERPRSGGGAVAEVLFNFGVRIVFFTNAGYFHRNKLSLLSPPVSMRSRFGPVVDFMQKYKADFCVSVLRGPVVLSPTQVRVQTYTQTNMSCR